MTAAELLESARRWQQAGDLPRAENAYRELLIGEQNNAELWYLLGVACRNQGKLDEALSAYQRAIELRPDLAQAHNGLGIVRQQQGRLAEAAASFESAVRARPDFAPAHNNLGNVLKETGRNDLAMTAYQEAVRLKPDFAEAHSNLGNLQRELGQVDEAMASCRLALQLKPDFAIGHNHLGAAYSKKRRWDDAAACYRQAIALLPAYPEAHSNLGDALRELGQLDEAAAHFREALRLRPDLAEPHAGLSLVLLQLGDLAGCQASCREALRLRSGAGSSQLNLTLSIVSLLEGRQEESLAYCEAALEQEPDSPEAHKNRAIVWLLQGRYREGWPEYEWRWKCPELPERPFKQPLWDGGPLDGRTIMLHAEQGLGDTIQFVRYVRRVRQRGGRVLVVCQKTLLPLLSQCEDIAQLAAQGDPLPPFDVHAPLLSLPGIFGDTLETIPAEVPYLRPDPRRFEQWRRELDELPGLRVGIAWQGSRSFYFDRLRSVPLAEFAPLAAVPGVTLVSLQKGFGSEQLAALAGRFRVVDLASRLDESSGPFVDTAAVMKSLDLVITSDTSIAHLAGALAVPVWVAIPFAPDWRWLLEREDSPWYPTMRLFRQTERGNWQIVFERIAAALAARSGEPLPARPITVEIAPGELLDKLTILEIKSERMTDAAKLANVRAELATLTAARDRAIRASAALDELTSELKRVNEALWEIEDEIRVCERQADFGPRFIELARSVYHQNDQRAAVKRRINDLLGSRLIEEKSYASYTR